MHWDWDLDSAGSAPKGAVRWPGAGALFALSLALRAPSFMREFLSDDESIYAVIGRAVAAGGRLYVDVVDHKPPAIYWLYGLAYQVVGDDYAMVLIHALTLLVVWATALAVGAIARRVANDTPDADRVAALLYVVFSTTMLSFDSMAANTELWMMLPASLSMLFLLENKSWAHALGAGALLAVATTFKYQAAIQVPLLLITALGARSLELGVRRAIVAAVGFAAPWLAVALWFQSRGDVGEALYWFKFNFAYIDAGSEPGEALQRAVPRVAFVVVPALLLYVGAARGVVPSLKGRAQQRWVLAWAALSAVAVCAGGRFFGHYFHQLTAPLAVLAVPAVVAFRSRRSAWTVAGFAVPAVVFLVVAWGRDAVMRQAARHPIKGVELSDAANYESVVRWLDERDPSRAGSICVWGNSPLLVGQARRPLGCRYVFANYMTGLSPGTYSQSRADVDASGNVYAGAWPRFVDDLNTRKPEFFVDASAGNVEQYGKFPLAKYADLWTIIQRDYTEIGVVERMRVFRRVRAGSP